MSQKPRRSSLEVAKERAEISKFRLEAKTNKMQLDAIKRTYEAANTSSQRPRRGDSKSANATMQHANTKLLFAARWLDNNHDISIGILDDLVNKIVGTGIGVEPMIKDKSGKLHTEANKIAKRIINEMSDARMETSRQIPGAELDRLTCRTWLRDGELFPRHIEGNAPINHRGPLPYSIEILESDMVPFHLTKARTDKSPRIIHGVSINEWKEPLGFHFYKDHPGDMLVGSRFSIDTKEINASEISHLKFVRRFNQIRGISIFHGVFTRLDDIKDYEESERIAARVAAALTGYIKKNADFAGKYNMDSAGDRLMEMNPGMIFDNLLPGEEIGTISSDRPNTNLGKFRDDMLRAIASGTGTSSSAISNQFEGSYSSKRQESAERGVNYDKARNYFVDVWKKPIHLRQVDHMLIQGLLPLMSIDMNTIYDADYRGPATPWVDQGKEVKADLAAIKGRIVSRHQVMRKRGFDPSVVDEQIEADKYDEQNQTDEPVEKKEPEVKDDKKSKKDEEVAA